MSPRPGTGVREGYAIAVAIAMEDDGYQSIVRFFEPSAAFLAWARGLRGKAVYDVGAGDGSVARALAGKARDAVLTAGMALAEGCDDPADVPALVWVQLAPVLARAIPLGFVLLEEFDRIERERRQGGGEAR